MLFFFERHQRFGDCKPNEVYIGCNIFAEFKQDSIWLRDAADGKRMRIDRGSVEILYGAKREFYHQDAPKEEFGFGENPIVPRGWFVINRIATALCYVIAGSAAVWTFLHIFLGAG